MATDYEIQAKIEVLLKGQEDVKRRLTELDKGSATAAASMRGLSTATSQFGQYLAGAFSAVAIGNFARASVQSFSEVERRLNAITLQMRNLGISGEESLPKIVDHLRSIEREGGPALNDTVTAFQKLIGITRDVETALFATSVAANISEANFIPAASAAELLANVLQGRAKEAAKQLGIQLVGLNGIEKTNAEIIEEVIKQYSNMGDSLNDTENLLDRNRAGWEELKRSAGSGISTIIKGLDSWGLNLGNVVALVKTIGLAFNSAVYQIFGALKVIGQGMLDTFDFKRLLTSPSTYIETLRDNFARGLQEIGATNAETATEFKRIWGETQQAITQDAKTQEEARQRLVDQARRKADQEQRATELKAIADLAEARADAEKDSDAGRLKSRLAAIDAAQDAELASVEGGEAVKQAIRDKYDIKRNQARDEESRLVLARQADELKAFAQSEEAKSRLQGTSAEQRLQHQLAALKAQEDAEIAAANRNAAVIKSIRERYEAERENARREFNARQADEAIQSEVRILNAQLEFSELSEEKRLELRIKLLDKMYRAEITAAEREGKSSTSIYLAWWLNVLAVVEEARRAAAERAANFENEALSAEAESRIAAIEAEIETKRALGESLFESQRELIQAEADERIRVLDDELERRIETEAKSEAEIATLRKIYLDKKLAEEQRTTAAIIALQKAERDAKRAQYISAARTAVESLETIFGKSKATAIATAIINTAEGVTKALDLPFPLNFIVAGLVAAAGAAEIAKIRKTDISKGGGFDDPANDREARLGGRRWAKDALREIAIGWREGLKDLTWPAPVQNNSGSTSTTTIRSGDVVVNVTGLYGGDAGIRQLAREIEIARRRDAGVYQR